MCAPPPSSLAWPEPLSGPHHAATTGAEERKAEKDAAAARGEREMEKEGGSGDAKRSSQETGDELQK